MSFHCLWPRQHCLLGKQGPHLQCCSGSECNLVWNPSLQARSPLLLCRPSACGLGELAHEINQVLRVTALQHCGFHQESEGSACACEVWLCPGPAPASAGAKLLSRLGSSLSWGCGVNSLGAVWKAAEMSELSFGFLGSGEPRSTLSFLKFHPLRFIHSCPPTK